MVEDSKHKQLRMLRVRGATLATFSEPITCQLSKNMRGYGAHCLSSLCRQQKWKPLSSLFFFESSILTSSVLLYLITVNYSVTTNKPHKTMLFYPAWQ